MTELFYAEDGQPRCKWVGIAPEFVAYHDAEWGFPVVDDTRLFEKLCLEGFQSGLSWRTILAKRDNFRAAFAGFDMRTVAAFTDADVARLLENAGIVRHKGKIEAAINNAARGLDLVAEYGTLAAYFWSYEPDEGELAAPLSLSLSAVSTAISKDLKKRGWKFVGPTTIYAFMQAMGLINDHAEGCCVRAQVVAARSTFQKPA